MWWIYHTCLHAQADGFFSDTPESSGKMWKIATFIGKKTKSSRWRPASWRQAWQGPEQVKAHPEQGPGADARAARKLCKIGKAEGGGALSKSCIELQIDYILWIDRSLCPAHPCVHAIEEAESMCSVMSLIVLPGRQSAPNRQPASPQRSSSGKETSWGCVKGTSCDFFLRSRARHNIGMRFLVLV